MGVFDLFGRENKIKAEEKEQRTIFTESEKPSKSPISVFNPTCYEDVEDIINALKSGKSAVVHLTDLKTETSVRILDMLSGAIFALDGGVYEMQKNIFMFSPNGVEING